MMKKVKKLLLLAAAVMLAAVVLLTGYIFVVLNWQYLFDLRSHALPYNDVIRTAEGVRVEHPYHDNEDYMEFNEERELLRSEGFTPIEFNHRNLWGYWSYEAFVAEYGEYHIDLGSMAYQPGWFTTDGYLITLWFGGETSHPLCISNIGEVQVYDLLAE
ncbi:MAG: hypothetical protein IJ438_11125 [Clostridia bacterium]|nr:hypothetical protein [Clostridia bacterium]